MVEWIRVSYNFASPKPRNLPTGRRQKGATDMDVGLHLVPHIANKVTGKVIRNSYHVTKNEKYLPALLRPSVQQTTILREEDVF